MSATRQRTEVEDQEKGKAHIVIVAHIVSAWEQETGKGKRETGGKGRRWETGSRKP